MMVNAASRKAEEQTMEDILNSIRRIMADDHKVAPVKAPEPAPTIPEPAVEGSIEEDIHALRTALNAIRGEMEDVKGDLAAQEEFQAAGLNTDDAGDAFEQPVAAPGLVSDTVEQTVRQSFSQLSQTAAARREVDVEAVAETLLRPMLQQWLDAHLPGLVEKLVREEISRISGNQA